MRCMRTRPGREPPGGPAELDAGHAVATLYELHYPARQREVVVLRYFADLPEAEIASATGMSMAAVRKHAAQAMSSLQAGLDR